ncbi:MAG: tetratricopeptide repeat protein, partial [Planctomyces sp.]
GSSGGVHGECVGAGDPAGAAEGGVLSFAGLAGGVRSESEPWTAEEWFHEGCRLSESGEFEQAVTVFRRSLCLLGSASGGLGVRRAGGWGGGEEPLQPDPADVNFHLADALYRGGRLEAAVERYYCAIEWAPEFIEAWSQLGCLQAELEEFEAAEESLRAALAIHPSNPDVLLSFAQLLDRLGRESEAVEYWRQYLQFDSRGPWSEHARMRAGGLESGIGGGCVAGAGLPLESLLD